jgi:hypothetical protein
MTAHSPGPARDSCRAPQTSHTWVARRVKQLARVTLGAFEQLLSRCFVAHMQGVGRPKLINISSSCLDCTRAVRSASASARCRPACGSSVS